LQLNGWAFNARGENPSQAAELAPAAERPMASLSDASSSWRRWVEFSTRGRSMTFRPVTDGSARYARPQVLLADDLRLGLADLTA